MDPWILTLDTDLLAMFDDLDEFLDNEDCDCEGTCGCEDG